MSLVELQRVRTAFLVRDSPTQEVIRGTIAHGGVLPVSHTDPGLIFRTKHNPLSPSTRIGRDQQCKKNAIRIIESYKSKWTISGGSSVTMRNSPRSVGVSSCAGHTGWMTRKGLAQ